MVGEARGLQHLLHQGTGEPEGGTGQQTDGKARQPAEMDHRLAGIVQLGENRACHQSAPAVDAPARCKPAPVSAPTGETRAAGAKKEKISLI